MEHLISKIESALEECSIHANRVEKALHLVGFFPLSVRKRDSLSDRDIINLDHLAYRFTKLQDAMGRRLLPSLHAYLEQAEDGVPLIDRLNDLEKLGVLPSVERWNYFRRIRNDLSHEYPDEPESIVTNLNEFHQALPEFLSLFEHVAMKARESLPD